MNLGNKKFVSIIFPSRGRLDLLKQLLMSIENNTYNSKWIEVICICDQDDKATIDLLTEISQKISFDFYFIVRKKQNTINLPNDYYKFLLKLKSDSYITWCLGNDTEIITKNWDINLYFYLINNLPEFFSDIDNNKYYYYFTINDNSHWSASGNIQPENDQSCCFPLISDNYCKDAGEIFPSEYPTWKGDTMLHGLMSSSPRCKLIMINDIIEIQHYTHHTKTYEKDQIANEIESSFMDSQHITDYINIEQLLNNRPFLKQIYE